MVSNTTFNILLTLLFLSTLSACVSVPSEAQLFRKDEQLQLSPDCRTPVSVHSTTVTPLPDSFSLVSWNIHKGSDAGWSNDLQDLFNKYDLLLLQEAHLDPEMQKLLDDWPGYWAMGPAFSLQRMHVGVLTAARLSDAAACSTLVNEPLTGIPKALLITYYPIAGQEKNMLVANIHGVNFTLGTQELAQQLDFIAEAIADHQGPVVMAGDFNTWSKARMRLLHSMAESTGLQSVHFNGQQQSKHLGQAVDHIYYRGLKLVNSQVLTLKTSDHLPLSVQFELE